MLTHFRETTIGRPAGPRPADSFEIHKQQPKPTRRLSPSPKPEIHRRRRGPPGPDTHLMINRNMAQKHMSTASTDSMFENSATDTSIAVMATNMVAAAHTDRTSGLRRGGIAIEGRRRHRTNRVPGLRRVLGWATRARDRRLCDDDRQRADSSTNKLRSAAGLAAITDRRRGNELLLLDGDGVRFRLGERIERQPADCWDSADDQNRRRRRAHADKHTGRSHARAKTCAATARLERCRRLGE